MKRRRIMLAAPKSGSGKTIVTCALLKALKEQGEHPVSYKCGPDYIDPMFHQKVLGIPSKNLDTFFTREEKTRELFMENASVDDFAVLEGVMGLYDGLGGIREEGSSYHLAKVTKTPIILVIDAKGMGRSVLAMIAGFLAYDKEKLIKGVILNKMSGALFALLKPIIEEELKIKAIGYLPTLKDLQLESRHLGLILPDEYSNLTEQLSLLSTKVQATVSLSEINEIAEGAQELTVDCGSKKEQVNVKEDAPVIAVAKDEAFCFYYEDNLRLLEAYGAKLVFFSPIHDQCLPKECHALLLGGGYPELSCEALSKNMSMLASIKEAVTKGMPVVAECGGFMYLHSAITTKDGIRYPMADVIPAEVSDQGKLVRFGYIEIIEHQAHFLPEGTKIKGHEFHYFDSTLNGEDCTAVKPASQRSYSCIIDRDNCFVGFPHLYYPSNPIFAKNFVNKALQFKGRFA